MDGQNRTVKSYVVRNDAFQKQQGYEASYLKYFHYFSDTSGTVTLNVVKDTGVCDHVRNDCSSSISSHLRRPVVKIDPVRSFVVKTGSKKCFLRPLEQSILKLLFKLTGQLKTLEFHENPNKTTVRVSRIFVRLNPLTAHSVPFPLIDF